MKMNIDLTAKLLQKQNEQRKKIKHRYSCSQIYGLLKGWTTPEEYLKGKEFTFLEAFRMFQGTWKHKQIQELMPEYQQEIKKKLKVGKLTIVGQADLLNENEVIEIKTSDKVFNKAKDWHEFQVKLYCVLFNRPKGIVVQPLVSGNKLLLNIIGEVKKDETWFAKQMEKLQQVDEEIQKANEELQILADEEIDEDFETENYKENIILWKTQHSTEK